jgi:hypothetical protein
MCNMCVNVVSFRESNSIFTDKISLSSQHRELLFNLSNKFQTSDQYRSKVIHICYQENNAIINESSNY